MDTLCKDTGQATLCHMNARMGYDLVHIRANSSKTVDFNYFTLIYHRFVRQKVDFEEGTKTFGWSS